MNFQINLEKESKNPICLVRVSLSLTQELSLSRFFSLHFGSVSVRLVFLWFLVFVSVEVCEEFRSQFCVCLELCAGSEMVIVGFVCSTFFEQTSCGMSEGDL